MLSLEQAKNKAYRLVTEKYEKNGKLDRLTHIYGVAKMAVYLAKIYGIDENKAVIAAYMHDYYKYESNEEMAYVISNEDLIRECERINVLYHAYASATACRKLIIDDEEIYLAIKKHVFGDDNMSKLEEIILISDYTEENRVYEDCIKCRDVLLNIGINTAIYYSTANVIKHLENTNRKADEMQFKILKKYKEKMKMEMLKQIKDNIDRVKGYDVICYDMKGISPLFDYMFIVTIDSPRQADALAEYIKEDYAKAGIDLRAIEGKGSTWVLMDCRDVIIHIFTKEEREHYSLEKIYMEMPKLEL